MDGWVYVSTMMLYNVEDEWLHKNALQHMYTHLGNEWQVGEPVKTGRSLWEA